MKKILIVTCVGLAFLLQDFNSFAFEIGTHEELSRKTVTASLSLNALFDINREIKGKKIIDWISEVGSRKEDDELRFLNHFHNPLRTWDRAGLLGSTAGASSIIWGQDGAQGFAWQNARDEYFLGLTSTTEEDRERHLANTFRALGQLIHLVQDAAQPAHTRNDPHPIITGFEGYVENIRLTDTALFNSWVNSSVGFDQGILTLSGNPLAPIPVARIIDTTDPEQASAVPSAGTNQGIAEYSNANFLSEDTIFKDFTFPRVQSLGAPVDGIEPVTNRPRRYFPKVADGDTGYRLVAEGVWWETLISLSAGDQGYILDSEVRNDYAAKLLPRAIGYSAGLIDYFFRGELGLGSLGVFLDPDGLVRKMIIGWQNGSDEEAGIGELTIAVPFRQDNEIRYARSTQTINLTRESQQAEFDFSNDPWPFDFEFLNCRFFPGVYRGPLGMEESAVIVGGLDIGCD